MASSFATYVAVFALLAVPWLRDATHAIPRSWSEAQPEDARLVIWVLGWGAHAVATDPAHLFDANINYPASRQLTGSEHLLASQLVFGPVYALTGNPVLGANVTAFLSYPIAALVMERLLLALGCARSVAAVSGVGFALGPLRVPANLQLLQYQNLYLPLAVLTLTALRRRARAPTAVAFAAVVLAGLLSAFYLAAILCVALAVWTVCEWTRPGPGRVRFLLLAGSALASAIALFVLASMPYWTRPEAQPVSGDAAHRMPVWLLAQLLTVAFPAWSGTVPIALAALGLAALALRHPPGVSRLVVTGALLTLAGLVLAFPPSPLLGLILASPLRFFRYTIRFVVLAGFGMSVLAAAGLETIRVRFSRLGIALVLAAGVAILLTRGMRLAGLGTEEIPAWGAAASVYEEVGRVARSDDGGSFLELPLDTPAARNRESDAMVGSIHHWLPLVAGRTGYAPPHRGLVHETLGRLPAPEAVDDLVDMTHVRWVLFRPETEWGDRARRAALLELPRTHRVLEEGGWVLLQIEGEPRHPAWFAAIARGGRPGETLLGTPLRRLAEGEAVARIRVRGVRDEVRAGDRLWLAIDVSNAGRVDWPVAVGPGAVEPFCVHLAARWWAFRPRLGMSQDYEVRLPRDLPAGEATTVMTVLKAPERPGQYLLEVSAKQKDGALFVGHGNVPFRHVLIVVPAADAGTRSTS